MRHICDFECQVISSESWMVPLIFLLYSDLKFYIILRRRFILIPQAQLHSSWPKVRFLTTIQMF